MQRRKGGRQPFRPRQKVREHRLNNEIDFPEVRVVGEGIEAGVYPTAVAIGMARDMEADLVEINAQAVPPICRIIDYNKFLYEKKKKDKEQKAKSKQSELKEIRFTPNTDDHDFDFKSKHAEKFLSEGDKVKCYVQFRGRSIMFQERGELMLLKFAERLAEVGTLESMPKMEGRRMIAIFVPKKKK